MSNDATRQWLMKVAEAVEHWPTMPKDNVAVAMVTDTPTGAMIYIASKIPIGEARGRPCGSPDYYHG